MSEIPILSDEEISRAPWGVVRSDLVGVIQLLRGHESFAHIENGNRYDSAFWSDRSTDLSRAQAPHLVLKVVVENLTGGGDENYYDQDQRSYGTVINRGELTIESTIQAPLKDLATIKDEARNRTYQIHSGVLAETDAIILHDLERTDRSAPAWVTTERDTLWSLYDTTFAEIDAALSWTDVKNAENNYATQVRGAVNQRPEFIWETSVARRR